jgi:hypothetical protein
MATAGIAAHALTVLQALDAYEAGNENSRYGYRHVSGSELQNLTGLQDHYVTAAVRLLESRGHVRVWWFATMEPLALSLMLTPQGQMEAQIPPTPVGPIQAKSVIIAHNISHAAIMQDTQASLQTVYAQTGHAEAIRDCLRQILDRLPELGLSPDDQATIETESQMALVQLESSRPRMAPVQESMGLVVRLLEGAGGNAVYEGAKSVAPLAGELAQRLAQSLGLA